VYGHTFSTTKALLLLFTDKTGSALVILLMKHNKVTCHQTYHSLPMQGTDQLNQCQQQLTAQHT
jgi:hypothetical protein